MRYYMNNGKIKTCDPYMVMPIGFKYWEAIEQGQYYGLSETFDTYFLFKDSSNNIFESKAYSYKVTDRNLLNELIYENEDAVFLISNLQSNYFSVPPKNIPLNTLKKSRKIFIEQYNNLILDVQDRLSIDTNENSHYVRQDNIFNELMANRKEIDGLKFQLF